MVQTELRHGRVSEVLIRAGVVENLIKRPLKIVACAAKFIADSSLPVSVGPVGTTKDDEDQPFGGTDCSSGGFSGRRNAANNGGTG
jgi:hypothetical protein